MKKKLTLRLDEDLIRFAKEHAAERGQSVSKLVENYFAVLNDLDNDVSEDQNLEQELGPITRSLYGMLEGHDVSEEDYYQYLWKKHQ